MIVQVSALLLVLLQPLARARYGPIFPDETVVDVQSVQDVPVAVDAQSVLDFPFVDPSTINTQSVEDVPFADSSTVDTQTNLDVQVMDYGSETTTAPAVTTSPSDTPTDNPTDAPTPAPPVGPAPTPSAVPPPAPTPSAVPPPAPTPSAVPPPAPTPSAVPPPAPTPAPTDSSLPPPAPTPSPKVDPPVRQAPTPAPIVSTTKSTRPATSFVSTRRTTAAPTTAPSKCPGTMPSNAICNHYWQGENVSQPITTRTCIRSDQLHTCTISGDPHISTFEGCVYHHMGAGHHITVANRRFASIQLEKECGASRSSDRRQYSCAGRADPVTFMAPGAVSCDFSTKLVVYSDAYADRLDHCDAGYGCASGSRVDFSQTDLKTDVLVYDIQCSSSGCSVGQYNWATQTTTTLRPTNVSDINVGTASRPVLLRKTASGVKFVMDTEFGCAGTVLEYGWFSFKATIDAGCTADRGQAVGMYGTGKSPLYGRTFGLCGHIDEIGRTGRGLRPGNEYSAMGQRRPTYPTRCRQYDWGQFLALPNWAALARQMMCGEQMAQIADDLHAVLGQLLVSSRACTYLAPGGARVLDPGADVWATFQALADSTPAEPDQPAEPAVACDTIDMFFDALGSCEMALLDPNGMTPDELTQRNSSLQICLYDACRTKDLGIAVSNTVGFRQSMQETSWQVEEIIAVAAAAVVGAVALLVGGVIWYRRRLQNEHRQALLKFQNEIAEQQNKSPIQFAI